jgi:hypothetical protein
MKNLRAMVSIALAMISLSAPRVGMAQVSSGPTAAASAPVVVLHNTDPSAVGASDLQGVPPAVAKLIVSFNALRDKYLLRQHLLLEKLQDATTQEQRSAIREQLQDNRQAFLDELADFRSQLKNELKSVQGRVSNAEFLRIIDAAQSATGDHHHRGH